MGAAVSRRRGKVVILQGPGQVPGRGEWRTHTPLNEPRKS